MTERVRKLRELLFQGSHKAYRVQSLETSILNPETEPRSRQVRKALAVARSMDLMPIYIQPGELIVGGKTVYTLPAYFTERELEIGNPNREADGYPNMFDTVFNLGQDERGYGLANSSVPAYGRYLEGGFPGMLALARQGLAHAEQPRQRDFYESVIIVYEGILRLCGRYRALALEQAEAEPDAARAAELREIATVMQALSERGPRDYREALQTVYLFQFLLWQEGGYLVPLGRFDQYMLPYYRRSLQQGLHTHEQMIELTECMFLKLNQEIDQTHGGDGKFQSDTGQTVTVGGVHPQSGRDVTNELSYLCIDVKSDLRTTDPRLHVRFHRHSPRELWTRCTALTAEGMGFPTYDCDENIVAALRSHPDDYSLEDARDYCASGCWEIIVPGKSFNRNLGDVDCLRSLEWALNDGQNLLPVDPGTVGMVDGRWGLRTGHPDNFESFEELMGAFRAQMKHHIDTVACNCNKGRLATAPLYSSLMESCMDRGLDLAHGGGAIYETDFQLSSLANAADALYAIRRLVFEQGRYTLGELTDILRSNFEGQEPLRQELVNKMPKFGNADPEVDAIASDIVQYFAAEVTKHRNNYGGPYRARIASSLGYVSIARTLGASADGRKHGDFYAADLAPGLGAERSGPTAAVSSCGGVPTEHLAGGSIMDLTFAAGALATAENREKFADMIQVYFRLGGLQAQFNVADPDTLRDAQRHPERYPDLMVRVWGFSAYFTGIPRDFQDHIIERTRLSV